VRRCSCSCCSSTAAGCCIWHAPQSRHQPCCTRGPHAAASSTRFSCRSFQLLQQHCCSRLQGSALGKLQRLHSAALANIVCHSGTAQYWRASPTQELRWQEPDPLPLKPRALSVPSLRLQGCPRLQRCREPLCCAAGCT
jgi:hypothetical protein